MKPGGVPDSTRAARIVLKDFVQGKLNYCKAPPDVAQVYFFSFQECFLYVANRPNDYLICSSAHFIDLLFKQDFSQVSVV